ncbi:MAG TPA: YciI family protein [Chitinophagaceae bacterium]
MKDFMFIFRGGLDPSSASPQDMENNMQQWFAWIEDLKQRNIYASGEALLPEGKTVHKQNVVTDGPFAESKEIVGGFFVVKTNTLEDALEVAKSCPDLPLGGSVEVREVMKF